MSSARFHRGTAVALALSLLLALPVGAHAGAAPPRQAPAASGWTGFLGGLRQSVLGGWLGLLDWVNGVVHPKDGTATTQGGTINPDPAGGIGQHPTIDPNGG